MGIGADGKGTTDTPLKFPHKDAKLIASHFATMPKGKYWQQIQKKVLKPAEVTPKGIEKALITLSTKLTAKDMLVIYLSGHGRRNLSGGPIFVTNKGPLLWKKLAKWLGKVKARTLVLLDACRYGDVGIVGTPIDNNALVANLIAKRDAGILVFSAARSWQNTYEWGDKKSGHRFFATAISKAFSDSTDINQDGVISLSEFRDFTTTEVERSSGELFKNKIAEIRQSTLEGSFTPEFDAFFHNLIRIPHTPWQPNMELFGDIPLIPVGD